MGSTRSPETSALNQPTLHNIPEDGKIQVNRISHFCLHSTFLQTPSPKLTSSNRLSLHKVIINSTRANTMSTRLAGKSTNVAWDSFSWPHHRFSPVCIEFKCLRVTSRRIKTSKHIKTVGHKSNSSYGHLHRLPQLIRSE